MNNKILLVDPDPVSIKEYTSLLQAEGYEVTTSDRISDCVEKVEWGSFDCIVMDVDLMDMKGYDAVDIIRSIDPKIEIILTAMENTKELEAKVRAQDIFYYYIKSFQTEELITAVNNVFKKLGKEDNKMKDGPVRILVIDDDPDFLKSMQLTLESAAYEFLSAANPQDGMEKIKSEHPDIILLDIMMDSLFDGFSMCHTLKTSKEYRAYRHTPIIFVSAVKQLAGSRFAFRGSEYGMAGPDDYMDKPIDPSDLLERIEKHLGK